MRFHFILNIRLIYLGNLCKKYRGNSSISLQGALASHAGPHLPPYQEWRFRPGLLTRQPVFWRCHERLSDIRKRKNKRKKKTWRGRIVDTIVVSHSSSRNKLYVAYISSAKISTLYTRITVQAELTPLQCPKGPYGNCRRSCVIEGWWK